MYLGFDCEKNFGMVLNFKEICYFSFYSKKLCAVIFKRFWNSEIIFMNQKFLEYQNGLFNHLKKTDLSGRAGWSHLTGVRQPVQQLLGEPVGGQGQGVHVFAYKTIG